MNQPLLDVIMNGLAAGRPRDALAALTASRLPIADASGPLVLAAAEALAAVGHERRALALLTVATRTHTDDRSLAVACARASLARGHHLRAQRVLEPHVASTGLLMSVARREPLPPVASALDVDDEIDRAMATATTTAALTALLERAPSSARLRIGIAMRLRHEGQNDEGRGLLRAGLKGREDARLEVALAAAAVQDEVWDEAAMVIARARARHPALGRSAALRLVLAAVAVGAGKTDDAISIIHGASGLQPAEQALLKLLKLPPVAPFSTVVSSSPPPTTDTAPSATSVASPPAPSTVTSLAHDAPQSQWRGPVAPPDEPAEKGSPWVWLAFAVVLVGGTAALVLPKFLGAPAAPPDVGVVAVVDAGIGLLDAGVPPTAPTAFSIAARGCGIPFDSWADGAGPLSHLSELPAALGG